MSSPTLKMLLLGEDRSASKALKGVGAQADKTRAQVSRMSSGTSKAFTEMRRAFVAGSVTAGVIGWVKAGSEYTGTLAKIQALSGKQEDVTKAVASSLESSRVQFAKYGLTVADAAEGVMELVKAGQTLPNALKSVNATMVLAKAGNLDVASSAELVSNELNAFKLPAKNAMDIANQLANAANLSSADVVDLGESLKYVSVVADHAGLSFSQTSAYLAILSNAGLKGSLAGTGLRKVIQSLEAPTMHAQDVLDSLGVSAFDSSGKAKPLAKTLAEISKAMAPLSAKDRKLDLRMLFGLTGLEAGNIILDNTGKGMAKMTRGVERAGAAQKLAEANSKGLMGTLKQLRAEAVDDADIIYRKWSPIADKAIKPLIPAMDHLAHGAAELGQFINGLPGPLKSTAIEAGIAALVMPRLAASVGGVTSSVGGNIAAFKQWRAELTYTETRGRAVANVTSAIGSAAKQAAGIGGMVALADSAHRTGTELGTLEQVAGGAATGFSVGGPWGVAIGGAAGLAFGLYQQIKRSNATLGEVQQAVKDAEAGYSSIRSSLDKTTGAYSRNTAAAIANQLTTTSSGKKFVAAMQGYGIGTEVIGRAATGSKSALEKVNLAVDDLSSGARAAAAQNAVLNQQLEALKNHKPVDGNDLRDTMAKEQSLKAQIANNKKLITQKSALSDFWTSTQRAAMSARDDAKMAIAKMGALKLAAHGVPKDVALNITTGGVQHTLDDAKKIAAQYQGLTARDYKILLKAEGVPATKANIAAVGAAVAAMAARANASLGNIHDQSVSIDFNINRIDHHGAGNAAQSSRHSGGYTPPAGRRSTSGSAFSPRLALGMPTELSARPRPHGRNTLSLSDEGRDMVASFISGTKKEKTKLGEALKGIRDQVRQARKQFKDDMASFADSFTGFTTSVFGADYGTDANGNAIPPTVSAILAKAQSNKADADALNENITKLIGEGLNGNVIQQFQSEGSSGVGVLNALASGASLSDIQRLNDLTDGTLNADRAAGQAAAGVVAGTAGTALFNDKQAEMLATKLASKIAGLGDLGTDVYVVLDGKTIEASVKKVHRKQGKK